MFHSFFVYFSSLVYPVRKFILLVLAYILISPPHVLHYPNIFGFKSPTENLSKISRIAAEDFLLKMDVKSAYDNVNRECAISGFFGEMKRLLGGDVHLYLHHFKMVKKSKIEGELDKSYGFGKYGTKRNKIFSIYLPFKIKNLDKITNYQQTYLEKITLRYSF